MSGLYDRILVPLDGSEIAKQALPYALQLASQSGAELILFRVVSDLKSEVAIKNIRPVIELNDEQQQYLVDHATEWLQQLTDDLALHNIRAQAVVDVGEAADRIVDYAMLANIDLIIMCTHGRTGIARWRYGSVATKVLEEACCPVLMVRSRLPVPVTQPDSQTADATS